MTSKGLIDAEDQSLSCKSTALDISCVGGSESVGRQRMLSPRRKPLGPPSPLDTGITHLGGGAHLSFMGIVGQRHGWILCLDHSGARRIICWRRTRKERAMGLCSHSHRRESLVLRGMVSFGAQRVGVHNLPTATRWDFGGTSGPDLELSFRGGASASGLARRARLALPSLPLGHLELRDGFTRISLFVSRIGRSRTRCRTYTFHIPKRRS